MPKFLVYRHGKNKKNQPKDQICPVGIVDCDSPTTAIEILLTRLTVFNNQFLFVVAEENALAKDWNTVIEQDDNCYQMPKWIESDGSDSSQDAFKFQVQISIRMTSFLERRYHLGGPCPISVVQDWLVANGWHGTLGEILVKEWVSSGLVCASTSTKRPLNGLLN